MTKLSPINWLTVWHGLESQPAGNSSSTQGDIIQLAQTDTAQVDNFAAGPIEERVNSIDALDFRRGPMGEGRVIFDLSSAGIVTDMRQEGGRLIVEFPDTQLAAKLQKRLDVMDFGTPVQFIDAISNKRGTKVIIQPATQDFEQLAYQSDNLFTVELKPMSREDIEENRKAWAEFDTDAANKMLDEMGNGQKGSLKFEKGSSKDDLFGDQKKEWWHHSKAHLLRCSGFSGTRHT